MDNKKDIKNRHKFIPRESDGSPMCPEKFKVMWEHRAQKLYDIKAGKIPREQRQFYIDHVINEFLDVQMERHLKAYNLIDETSIKPRANKRGRTHWKIENRMQGLI